MTSNDHSPIGPRARIIARLLVVPALVLLFQACSSDGGGGSKPDLGSPEPSSPSSLFACSPCNPYPGMYGVAG